MYVKFERWSGNDTFMVNSLDFSREQTVLQNSSGVISNNKIKTNTPESIYYQRVKVNTQNVNYSPQYKPRRRPVSRAIFSHYMGPNITCCFY